MAENIEIEYNNIDGSDVENMKESFNAKVKEIIEQKKSNNRYFDEERYQRIIQHVNDLKSGQRKKLPPDYQILKRYDVVRVGNTDKLIYPVAEGNTSIKYYVTYAELFNILHEAHLQIGHGGRNRMIKELQNKYKNITTESIMIYLSLCLPCLKKAKITKKGLVVKPMIFNDMNSRGQVDLIDMQTQPSGEYK